MLSFALEFRSEDDLNEAVDLLRNKYRVTGELYARPLGGGRWRLVVHSEKHLRDGTIDKLKGRRVDDAGA